jgi:hypothetical protein
MRPLDGSTVRQFVAASSIDFGEAVTLRTADGLVQKTANGSAKCIGIAVSGSGGAGRTGVVAGESVGVVVFGPVAGFSGMTPGARAFLAATAGGLDTAGTVAAGYSEGAEVLFVMPSLADAAS